jgi:hypothetical protein
MVFVSRPRTVLAGFRLGDCRQSRSKHAPPESQLNTVGSLRLAAVNTRVSPRWTCQLFPSKLTEPARWRYRYRPCCPLCGHAVRARSSPSRWGDPGSAKRGARVHPASRQTMLITVTGEDCLEARGGLRVPVAQQEPQPVGAVVEIEQEKERHPLGHPYRASDGSSARACSSSLHTAYARRPTRVRKPVDRRPPPGQRAPDPTMTIRSAPPARIQPPPMSTQGAPGPPPAMSASTTPPLSRPEAVPPEAT